MGNSENGEKPSGGGNKPNKPGNGGGNGGGNGNGNKPNKPNKPENGGGNEPNKPENGGGNKPNKPGNGGGNKPNKPGNGGGNKPVTCDLATNFPCVMFGQECVDGDKGPTCQKPETTMPVMPPCAVECLPGCFCVMSQCFCPPEVMGDTDLSMEDLWKTLSCASNAVGNVKSKDCKDSCMKEDSDIVSCSTCVVSTTDCLAGVAGGI